MHVQSIPNIKFQVTSAQSRDIQEALFSRGGKWGVSGPVVQKTHQPFLKLRKGALSLVNQAEGGYTKWSESPHRLVHASEALRLIADCEVPAPPRKIEVAMSTVFELLADEYDTDPGNIKLIDG